MQEAPVRAGSTRRRLAVAAAALAAVVAVAVAVPLTLAARRPAVAPPASPVPPDPTPARLPPALEARVDRAHARPPVPVAQDGGEFRVEAVAPDGTLVGGAGLNVDVERATDDRVGIVPPGETRVRWLTGAGTYWRRVAGDGVVAWAHAPDGPWSLQSDVMCASARTGWRPVRLGATWETRGGVHAGGRTVAWNDPDYETIWVSEDCRPARRLGSGAVAAVTGGRAYGFGRTVRFQWVDVATGKATRMPGVSMHSSSFAATDDTVLTVRDEKLTIHRGGKVREIAGIFFLPIDGIADLTVGRRVAAYSVRGDGGRPWSDAVVVDLATGERVELETVAYAAGGQLVWREGDHYTVATVR